MASVNELVNVTSKEEQLKLDLIDILSFKWHYVFDDVFFLLLALFLVLFVYGYFVKNNTYHFIKALIIGVAFIYVGYNYQGEVKSSRINVNDITYLTEIKEVKHREVELARWERELNDYLATLPVMKTTKLYTFEYKNKNYVNVNFKDVDGISSSVVATNIGYSKDRESFITYSILGSDINYEYSKGQMVNVTIFMPQPYYYILEEYKQSYLDSKRKYLYEPYSK